MTMIGTAPGGSGTIAIGSPVTGGTDNAILFIDPTATLAEDPTLFSYDKANTRFAVGLDAASATNTVHIVGQEDNAFLVERTFGTSTNPTSIRITDDIFGFGVEGTAMEYTDGNDLYGSYVGDFTNIGIGPGYYAGLFNFTDNDIITFRVYENFLRASVEIGSATTQMGQLLIDYNTSRVGHVTATLNARDDNDDRAGDVNVQVDQISISVDDGAATIARDLKTIDKTEYNLNNIDHDYEFNTENLDGAMVIDGGADQVRFLASVKFEDAAGNQIGLFNPNVASSGSAIAWELDTDNTLTSTETLLNIKNNGTAIAAVNAEGTISNFGGFDAAGFFHIGNASQTAASFVTQDSSFNNILILNPFIADSGSNVAYKYDTENALTSTNVFHTQWANNDSILAGIDKDGRIVGAYTEGGNTAGGDLQIAGGPSTGTGEGGGIVHDFTHPGSAGTNINDYRTHLKEIAGYTTTTDGTATTIKSVPTNSDTVINIEATITARRTGGTSGSAGDGGSYKIVGTFKNIGGTVTQIGTTSSLHSAEDQGGWDVDFNISGTDIQVRGTGATDNDVSWEAFITFNELDS